MIDPFPPKHMDKYSRNERLYRFLLGMGLIVNPIRLTDDLSRIDYLYVTAALSTTEATTANPSEAGAKTSVVAVMERTEVADIVGASEGYGDRKVIEFPSKGR
jgi:hypothetical protein